ncbi:MAG TPA: trypsin-like peptidase domain-containing protein [Gemmataceae bacterium]|jgi:serine protease Do|nr:trypsin-like peptidase domain-containing protein [Gemmataceae bacterium]
MRKHLLIGFCLALALPAAAADAVKDAELDRVNLIKKVRPAVVAVFMKSFEGDPRGRIAGGGSGVLIDKTGYCLTNYHVVAGPGMSGVTPTFACGLPNGEMYDAVTVGCDKTGDVALIKLFPKKPGDEFPIAELGDSGTLKPGDWTLIMGNAQLLSTDFTPSVSFGLVSGVGRYSNFGFAEHTDAIQYDTSANQGNSGGPIFNMKGQVIGLVYGGAPGKRGAFNTGIGYGLPINTAKHFLGHMRAGIFCDHATLGATINSQVSEEGDISRLLINQVLEDSDAFRRGIVEGDELLNFAGREIRSVNQFKSALGIFPKEWRLPVTIKKAGAGKREEILVRLQSYTPAVVKKAPGGAPEPPKPKPFGEGAKVFEERKGFANYYFNKLERDRLLAEAKKLADYSNLAGDWTWTGSFDREGRVSDFLLKLTEVPDPADPKATKPVVALNLGLTEYKLEPLKEGLDVATLTEPPYTGGLSAAFYQYKHFLTLGPKSYETDKVQHAGVEPVYLFPADGSKPKKHDDVKVFAEVIRTEHAAVPAKWYFYKAAYNPQVTGMHPFPDGTLIFAEVQVDRASDPCELYFGGYKDVGGKQLPTKVEVRNGDKRFAVFTVAQQQMK